MGADRVVPCKAVLGSEGRAHLRSRPTEGTLKSYADAGKFPEAQPLEDPRSPRGLSRFSRGWSYTARV